MAQRLLLGFFLALAVLAGGGAIYFQRLSDQYAARAAQLENDLTRARTEATKERERADKLTTKANELDTQLGNAKTRTTATESKNSQLSRELNAAKSSLTERQQREVALLSEIEALRQHLKAASEVASSTSLPPSSASANSPANTSSTTIVASSSPLTPTATPPPSSVTIATISSSAPAPVSAGPVSTEELDSYRERITALESQLTDLLTRALAEPAASPAPAPVVAAPSPYQVVRVGPDSAFVIVDYGALQGAAAGDELALCRGTSVVARVQISDARAKFSIAQVLPAGLKGQLQPGDFVLIAK